MWTTFLGGGQTGVVGAVFRASDRSLGYAFLVNEPGDEDSIRVTNVHGMGVFVLAWCNVVNGQVEVHALALDPLAATASPPTPIVAGPVDTPQLSGEATPLDDDCLLVWDDAQYGICGTTLTVTPQLAIQPGTLVAFGGGPDATEPTISKQGGGAGVHVVAWIDRPPGLPGWLRAQVVDHDMNLLGPGLYLQAAPQDAARPAIDGDGSLFVAVWEEQEVAHPSSTDVRGRTFLAGTAGVTSLGPVLVVAATPLDLDGAPDVARLGDKFAVAWTRRALAAPFTDDVFFRVLERSGVPCGDPLRVDVTTAPSYVFEHAPRLCGRRDGDESSSADDGVLVFADQDTTTADSDVGLQGVEAMGPGGAVVDLGGGCGPGGTAGVFGAFALGNAQCRLEVHGIAPLAIPFASLGVPRPPLSCGVCTLTDPLAFEFAPNTAGTSSRAFALPGQASLLGAVLEFQFVTFQVPFVGCPFAPGLAASNRVQATLGY